MEKVEVKTYWESRLRKSFGLHGVGYNGLDERFNILLYKIRKKVFAKLVSILGENLKNSSVLDIGSGTGFYIDLWKKNGVADLTGIDITEIAVNNLSERHRDVEFYQKDITDSQFDIGNKKFDVISIFDVLFHIVEEEKYEQALANINKLLKDDGILIMSDFFISNTEPIEKPHIIFRTKDQILRYLQDAGFEVWKTTPMFFFLNNPIGSKNWFIKRFFPHLIRIAREKPNLGYFIAIMVYPVELFFVKVFRQGPTTDIYLCRKFK